MLATVAHFTDPQSAELIGLMGIDCLWIDLEHQPIGMGASENMVRAARVCDMDVMAQACQGRVPADGAAARSRRARSSCTRVVNPPRRPG